MRSQSYLNSAGRVIQTYDGNIPLSAWLKQFFRSDKKFGSTDRKEISHAVYCYYRLGNSFRNEIIDERIVTGLFLCSSSTNKILEELKPEWNEDVALPPATKIQRLFASEEVKSIFPFANEISDEIEVEPFRLSFLIQPDLYLRVRPGKLNKASQQLEAAGVRFHLVSDCCIQLSNQTKAGDIINIDEDALIQDLNSQNVFNLFNNFKLQTKNAKPSVWDCCAASGGKSILFHDFFPDAYLTVSDVRESILINLQKRFKRAGIKNYDHFIADVSVPGYSMNKKFDVVICDAPCSGSGTWSRTPEQLVFFKAEKIDHYVNLQKKIVANTAKAVRKGGYFLYMTCSVFKKENEEVVEFLQSNTSLQLQEMQYLKGYDKKADTLFTALFLMK